MANLTNAELVHIYRNELWVKLYQNQLNKSIR